MVREILIEGFSSMAQKLAGTANVTIDGVTHEVVGDFNWSSYTVTRETLKSMSTNFPGYKETPQACFIEFTGRDMSDTPLSTFQDMTGVTVVAILANGKTLTGSNMVVVEALTVNSVEATFKLRFEGAKVTEGTL